MELLLHLTPMLIAFPMFDEPHVTRKTWGSFYCGWPILLLLTRSIQRPFVGSDLSRAHRKKQALCRLGTESFLQMTNRSDAFKHSAELSFLMRFDDPRSQGSEEHREPSQYGGEKVLHSQGSCMHPIEAR
jgi:hypothetical protein